MKRSILFFVMSLTVVSLFAQEFWVDVEESTIRADEANRWIIPTEYRTLSLELQALESYLKAAPIRSEDQTEVLNISIPLPNNTVEVFGIQLSPIMEAGLAQKIPDVKTYFGRGITNPTSSIYLDVTPQGFHGMILNGTGGAIFIDPYFRANTQYYVAYYKKDFKTQEAHTAWSCEVEGNTKEDTGNSRPDQEFPTPSKSRSSAPVILKTYRLAVAATGEYTAFHGGTVNGGQAAIVTAINRVSGVYETELGIKLELVANNNLLVFTDAVSDGYSNTVPSALLSENQTKVDNIIGTANYDVGHVFSTGGGGYAGLGVICNNSRKAQGETGLGSPTGDPFYIDYVAHEIGHQFGGNHTFNGSAGSCGGSNRNGSTAYEPGSGSTIQAYANICGLQNIANQSDPYFHLASLQEMTDHVTIESGANCFTATNTGNNTPVANANFENIDQKYIPINTPFELTGSATDPDADALTYSWEQWDLGPQGTINANSSAAPIFRSFPPSSTPTRVFPQLSDILNSTTTYGEILPLVNRNLNFQFIARDNRAEGGGFDADLITLKVTADAGPFSITIPNSGGTFSGASTVVWDVANTNLSPINCSTVDIFLSTDGGLTFPMTLATNVANDGNHVVTFPNISSNTARLKIKSSDNVFFDISDSNFSIDLSGPSDCAINTITAGSQSACNGNTNKYTQAITLIYTNRPATGNIIVNNQSFPLATSPQTITLTGLEADGAPVDIIAYFSDDNSCAKIANGLFTAPSACVMITCVSAAATDIPITISSSGQDEITSSIDIALDKIIQDVKVLNLNGKHTYFSDLTFSLTSPAGTTIVLVSGQCGDLNDFDLNLDNAGEPLMNSDCPVNTGGTYLPAESFDAFQGETTQGEWTLTVQDALNVDGGSLDGWSLEFCYFEEALPDCGTIARNEHPIATDTYIASIITSSGTIQGTVNFLANKEITLLPGFSTKPGADFLAAIQACTPGNIIAKPTPIAQTALKTPSADHQMEIFPNPTTGFTQIAYTLSTTALVQIHLFDANGQLIQAILPATEQAKGSYQVDVNISAFSPGMYYTVFNTPQQNITKKVVFMR